MPAIHLDKTTPPPVNPKKSGDYADTCPADGCMEVDRNWKIGGTDKRGEEYLRASMFYADVRKGGCGTSWSRTTKQGVEWDESRGVKSKWRTANADRSTFQLSTSERFRANYDCAFGRCGCPGIGSGHRCDAGCH